MSRFLVAVIIGQLAGRDAVRVPGRFRRMARGVRCSTGVLALAGFAARCRFRGDAAAPARPLRPPGRARPLSRDRRQSPGAGAVRLRVRRRRSSIFGMFPYIAPLLEARGAGGAVRGRARHRGVRASAASSIRLLVALDAARASGWPGCWSPAALSGLPASPAIAAASHWPLDAVAMVALGLGFYMLHNSFQTQVTEVAPRRAARRSRCTRSRSSCGQAIGAVALGFGLAAIGGGADAAARRARHRLALGVVAASVLRAGSAAARDRARRPGRAARDSSAARRSARTRRSGCRRADTNSRRCAESAAPATPRGACRSRRCNPRGTRRDRGSCADRASATSTRRASGPGT